MVIKILTSHFAKWTWDKILPFNVMFSFKCFQINVYFLETKNNELSDHFYNFLCTLVLHKGKACLVLKLSQRWKTPCYTCIITHTHTHTHKKNHLYDHTQKYANIIYINMHINKQSHVRPYTTIWKYDLHTHTHTEKKSYMQFYCKHSSDCTFLIFSIHQNLSFSAWLLSYEEGMKLVVTEKHPSYWSLV